MRRSEIKRELQRILADPKTDWQDAFTWEGQENYQQTYLSSFMQLDPCGRYHHVLSPNGLTARCERFWANLDETAHELDAWIEAGEGDLTDIFLCRNAPDTQADAGDDAATVDISAFVEDTEAETERD